MHTIKEIIALMKKIPVKHQEKIDKIKIISSLSSNKWDSIVGQVNDLRTGIKNEVREFITP